MEPILDYLRRAVQKGASDMFIVSGMPVSFKVDGEIRQEAEEKVMPDRANELVSSRQATTTSRSRSKTWPASVSAHTASAVRLRRSSGR